MMLEMDKRAVVIFRYKRKPTKGPMPLQYPNFASHYTVKKLFDIPVPSQDVTYQTLPGKE
jgi:hypothetical protein